MNRIQISAVLALAFALAGCSSNRTPVASTPPAPSRPNSIRVNGAPNEIPTGTKLDVRTNEVITSSSSEGKTYSAEVATDVVGSDGATLLPKGSPVELVLMETRQGRGIKGSSVQLGLRSVTVSGTTYQVVSQELSKTTGLGANRKTGEMVGGGAALGTLIGAAAGGGKGAVLGGLAGAAAGALAQVLTQGKDLRIPAETVLSFQLDEPLRLQPVPPTGVAPSASAGSVAPTSEPRSEARNQFQAQ